MGGKRCARRRRRGGKLPAILAVLAVLILLLVGLFSGGKEKPRDTEPEEHTDMPETPDTETEPEAAPDHVTTASGIACSLTDVGENAVYEGDLILVNNEVFYHFPEDPQLDCVLEKKTRDYIVRDGTVLLQPAAMTALNEMMAAFKAQGGDSRSVNVVAGHRTAEFQQHLFDQSAERNGLDHAERFVARPGGSEHHTGYALDFSILHEDGSSSEYDGQGQYAWINENCQDYGFVVRYAGEKKEITKIDEEAWHFRYVGIPHATEMVKQNLCLEEYIDYLRQFPFEGEHLLVDCASGSYEIWFCPADRVFLPDSGEYTLSGNNVDGVVVTVRVKGAA